MCVESFVPYDLGSLVDIPYRSQGIIMFDLDATYRAIERFRSDKVIRDWGLVALLYVRTEYPW